MFLKKNKKKCFLCYDVLKENYIEVVYQHLSEKGDGSIESSTLYLCDSCAEDIEKEQNAHMENLGENAREQDIKE